MRRALALAKAALAVAGCGGLVLLYLLAGPFAGPHGGSSGLGPSPHGAVQWSAAHGVQRVQQQLLAYLRRPLENITLDTGLPPPGYLVYNPSCRIPDTDPYHPSLEKLVKREDPVVCSTLPPLTSTRLIPVDNRQGALGSLAMYVLRLDVDLLPKYKPRFFHNVTCCYQSITRVDPKPESKADGKDVDNKFHMGRCEDLVREAQLDPEVEFVIVRCAASRIGGVNKTVYTNVHAVVAPKASVRAKLREYPPRGPDDPRLSVLVIGVDSVSRLNYFRTMPRTADLLRSHGWYELRGYNKIEDNTFPNLMAILTGMTRPQVEKTCFKTSMTPMDDCPFIWRNFSRAGYVTAYVEDEPTIGTFNYKKAGFAHAPTDYYLRPFLLAAQEHLKVRQQNHLNVCLGPSTAAEHILAFASSMASLLKDRLYFALFWMNSFSHNSVNSPSAMDDRMYYFWRDLLRSGALRNTLVLFLSDHGMRFGKIRETEIGWLEERLPFINVWLPESFRARYPSLDRGLRANEDRLTTPWDLHVTLRDVLAAPWGRVENTTAPEGAPSSSDSLTGCLACPRCSSLLQPVSANRGCADVAIEPHWCTCTEYRFMSTEDHTSRGAAQYVVDVIDAKMADNADAALSANWHCAPRTLKRVMSVRGRELENLDNVHRQDFIVILEASPGHAVFEATVRVSRNTSVSANMGDKQRVQHDLLGSISRINEFWEHSQCIHNADLKKYCHCTKGALPSKPRRPRPMARTKGG